MGIIVSKNDDKNVRLQERINADLRGRAELSARGNDADFSEDAHCTKNYKKTSKFAWVWVVLIILAVASIVAIVLV